MIASAIVSSIWGISLTQFIDYLQPILMTIIISYFTKSGLENFTSIKTASQETIQSTIQDTKVQQTQINANANANIVASTDSTIIPTTDTIQTDIIPVENIDNVGTNMETTLPQG